LLPPPTPAATNPPTERVPVGAGSDSGAPDAVTSVSGEKSKRPGPLSRLLALLTVCGGTAMAPGHACAQDASTDGALQEVVVTAERRSADIQTTAVSVTAISGSDLLDKHIDVIADLETQVPGLSVTDSGFTQNINIRGRQLDHRRTGVVIASAIRRPQRQRGTCAESLGVGQRQGNSGL
jgi:outer membrane receptor protein involved in Fe transport